MPPPSFGNLSRSTTLEVENRDTSPEKEGPNGVPQTFEMQEVPIKSPVKGRRRWRSTSRTRPSLDEKLESGEANKQVDDDESSHHGSVVASVVSMFEFISPRKSQTKKMSAESPAKLMESPASPKSEKKGLRNWIPMSPNRRSKECAPEVAGENIDTEDPRPSIKLLAAPSMLDIQLNLVDEHERGKTTPPSSPPSSPRRYNVVKSPRQSVMHRRRRSRTPECRRNSRNHAELEFENEEMDGLNSSQLSLNDTGSVLTAADTVVTTVTSCSEVVALPPNAKGPRRGGKDEAVSGRPMATRSAESLRSILRVNKYSAGHKEANTPDTLQSLCTSEHSTRSSRNPSTSNKSASSGSRTTDALVSPVKRIRQGSRSSTRTEGGEETRQRGRSRRPSEPSNRRSSIGTCATEGQESGRSESRRKSLGSRPSDDVPSPTLPIKSSRQNVTSTNRPVSRGKPHRRHSGHGSIHSSATDSSRTKEHTMATRSCHSKSSVHGRRSSGTSRTPKSRQQMLGAGEVNLRVPHLGPEMKKDFSKEVKREKIMDELKPQRGREEGGRAQNHTRHRSKSSKGGSRKSVESEYTSGTSGDAQKVKVRVVKKQRPKESREGEIAQLHIGGASESVLDVEYNPVAEVTT